MNGFGGLPRLPALRALGRFCANVCLVRLAGWWVEPCEKGLSTQWVLLSLLSVVKPDWCESLLSRMQGAAQTRALFVYSVGGLNHARRDLSTLSVLLSLR